MSKPPAFGGTPRGGKGFRPTGLWKKNVRIARQETGPAKRARILTYKE